MKLVLGSGLVLLGHWWLMDMTHGGTVTTKVLLDMQLAVIACCE